MTFGSIREAEARAHMPVYGRQPILFVRGEGTRLWDEGGREYLDFVSGIAVMSVGHSHPKVVAAVQEQAARLTHVSNLYYTEPQVRLAERLHRLLGWGMTFFGNSGAEANECAIKLARKWSRTRSGDGRVQVVSALGSFHGRTIATLAATGQPHKHAAFLPMPGEFLHVPLGDEAALDAAVGDRTSAVLLEVVQGEGGVAAAPLAFLEAARRLCDERGALLILDEVQTGLGRTGRWFGFQHTGVTPDIVTLGKALGGGLPISACIAREEVARVFAPGDHATTFGGGPVVCAAALAVLDAVEHEGLVANAEQMGLRLRDGLGRALAGNRAVREVRGLGLLVGVELAGEWSREVVETAREEGLLVNNVTPSVVRLAPPLTCSPAEVDRAVEVVAGILGRYADRA